MEFIVDWNAVCLICLQEGKMRSLYEKDSFGIILFEKIMKCSNIAISGKNFPEQICKVCEMDLDAAYRFRTNAESSNSILKSLLETQSITKFVTQPVEQQLIARPVTRKKIKKEVEQNEVVVEYDVTNSQLISQEYKSVSLQSNAASNDHLLLLRQKLLIAGVQKTENKSTVNRKPRKQISELADKRIIDELEDKKIINKVRVVTKTKTELTTKRANTAKVKNTNKPLKICEICGNSYKYQNALENHMRRHRNEKPFSCEVCHRSFVANAEIRRHMRVHTGQKPYTCRFCPRAFSDFGSRGKHERTHTGERPYACDTCGKTFAYAHVLQVHILTHTGEKKFKCNTCGKGFTKKSYLISHTNNNHRSNNELKK